MLPTATVSIRRPDGVIIQDAAIGDGPVDAIFKAVERVTGERWGFTYCPGVLETRVYRAVGIPAVALGPGPIECMHGPAEEVEVLDVPGTIEAELMADSLDLGLAGVGADA